eukprot:12640552-Prorocentrum_lima.AAC.1
MSASATDPPRPTNAQILVELKRFDRHGNEAAEEFEPFMRSLFGTDWAEANAVVLRGRDQWGTRWSCNMCHKEPDGIHQLMQH